MSEIDGTYDWIKKMPYDSPAYELCKDLGLGSHQCGSRGGWIYIEEIEKEKDAYRVMWTSERDTHYPIASGQPAVSAEYYPEKLGSVFKSYLSMHPVRTRIARVKYANGLTKKIQRAHNKENAPTPWWKFWKDEE